MVIKLFRVLLLITITVLFFSAKCNKDKAIPCPNLQTGYSFQVSSLLIPESEVYSVGDTIYLISMFPKNLNDQINTSMIINYSNSTDIKGLIGLVFLDSISQQYVPATDSFKFVDIEGHFNESKINQNRTKSTTYVELSDKYNFVGGIVCMKKGIYEINVDNLYSAGLRGTKCTRAVFNMEVTNRNKNISLFQFAIGQMPTIERQKIMYCFRVQ